jgi:hypothetical protein
MPKLSRGDSPTTFIKLEKWWAGRDLNPRSRNYEFLAFGPLSYLPIGGFGGTRTPTTLRSRDFCYPSNYEWIEKVPSVYRSITKPTKNYDIDFY